MARFAFRFDRNAEHGEVFFRFPQFPEIISSVGTTRFVRMTEEQKYKHASDAVVNALAARNFTKEGWPQSDSDNVRADGFVSVAKHPQTGAAIVAPFGATFN